MNGKARVGASSSSRQHYQQQHYQQQHLQNSQRLSGVGTNESVLAAVSVSVPTAMGLETALSENSTMAAYLPTKKRAPTHISRRRVNMDSIRYTAVARMNASNARKVLLEMRLAA